MLFILFKTLSQAQGCEASLFNQNRAGRLTMERIAEFEKSIIIG
jgi:hypothetical protein